MGGIVINAGAIYLLFLLLEKLPIKRVIIVSIVALLTAIQLYVNMLLINEVNKNLEPKYLRSNDVGVLEVLDKRFPNACVLSWWDYGHILKYYTSWRPVVDNGSHANSDLREVSKILFSDLSASSEPMKKMCKGEKYTLLYIPDNILKIANVIREFSLYNINTGKVSQQDQLSMQGGFVLDLKKPQHLPAGGVSFNAEKGVLTYGKEKVHVKSYRVISTGNKSMNRVYETNNLYFLVNYKNKYLIGGNIFYFNNFLYRGLFFEEWDKKKFSLVGLSDNSTVFLIK
ncbi:MAG: hypothetical protein GQ570_00395 [Helicobacteraceae bacterium]|nr:hypothetical protein [Helicobacteraceae bacterium]